VREQKQRLASLLTNVITQTPPGRKKQLVSEVGWHTAWARLGGRRCSRPALNRPAFRRQMNRATQLLLEDDFNDTDSEVAGLQLPETDEKLQQDYELFKTLADAACDLLEHSALEGCEWSNLVASEELQAYQFDRYPSVPRQPGGMLAHLLATDVLSQFEPGPSREWTRSLPVHTYDPHTYYLYYYYPFLFQAANPVGEDVSPLDILTRTAQNANTLRDELQTAHQLQEGGNKQSAKNKKKNFISSF
jgi:hypothetical protein